MVDRVMQISTVDLFLLELPLREPFVASHGETLCRTVTIVRVTTDIGIGWGECSALPAATYSPESAVGSFRAIAEVLSPLLIGPTLTHRLVAPLLADHRDKPMAVAALEMAVLDAELRHDDRSLTEWLGVVRSTVPAGVSIGLDDVDATVARAVALATEGYRRLKVKVQPGHDVDLVTAIRRELPAIELQIDANGAYGPGDLDQLQRVLDCGVDAVEQPFAPADEPLTRELIRRLARRRPVPVVADESVTSMADATGLLERQAMTGLSIKPARVGGLSAAVALHDLCLARGLAATAGGMLETGLGRHGLAALAGLAGFTVTGDLSPAGRWLTVDPWPDLEMIDGRITVPTGPGIAPDPDPGLLDHTTVERETVR